MNFLCVQGGSRLFRLLKYARLCGTESFKWPIKWKYGSSFCSGIQTIRNVGFTRDFRLFLFFCQSKRRGVLNLSLRLIYSIRSRMSGKRKDEKKMALL